MEFKGKDKPRYVQKLKNTRIQREECLRINTRIRPYDLSYCEVPDKTRGNTNVAVLSNILQAEFQAPAPTFQRIVITVVKREIAARTKRENM
jgi:hypothetical protein